MWFLRLGSAPSTTPFTTRQNRKSLPTRCRKRNLQYACMFSLYTYVIICMYVILTILRNSKMCIWGIWHRILYTNCLCTRDPGKTNTQHPFSWQVSPSWGSRRAPPACTIGAWDRQRRWDRQHLLYCPAYSSLILSIDCLCPCHGPLNVYIYIYIYE